MKIFYNTLTKSLNSCSVYKEKSRLSIFFIFYEKEYDKNERMRHFTHKQRQKFKFSSTPSDK